MSSARPVRSPGVPMPGCGREVGSQWRRRHALEPPALRFSGKRRGDVFCAAQRWCYGIARCPPRATGRGTARQGGEQSCISTRALRTPVDEIATRSSTVLLSARVRVSPWEIDPVTTPE